jgi:hypothetical protein
VVRGGSGELIKKGSRDVIILSNLGHLAIDALMEPNVFDNYSSQFVNAAKLATGPCGLLEQRKSHPFS